MSRSVSKMNTTPSSKIMKQHPPASRYTEPMSNIGFTKVKKFGQRSPDAGWNKHVDKYQKRTANRVIRRVLTQREEQDDS